MISKDVTVLIHEQLHTLVELLVAAAPYQLYPIIICPACNSRKHFEGHHVAALPQVPLRVHSKHVTAIDSEMGAPEVRSSLATPNSSLVSPHYAMILR